MVSFCELNVFYRNFIAWNHPERKHTKSRIFRPKRPDLANNRLETPKIAQPTPITENPGSGQRQKLKCHPGEGMHKIKYYCSSVVTCKENKINKEIAMPVNQNKSDPNLPCSIYPFPPNPHESQCPYPMKPQQRMAKEKTGNLALKT